MENTVQVMNTDQVITIHTSEVTCQEGMREGCKCRISSFIKANVPKGYAIIKTNQQTF